MFCKKDRCRLCHSSATQLILKMPHLPPVDNFRKLDDKELTLPQFPMDLYLCHECKHVQLLDVVSPEILYGNYIYTSSSSPDLDRHFTLYADRVVDRLQLKPPARILDVGSNDGLFLSKFKNKGFEVLGVDPSSYVASLAEKMGIPTEVGFFDHTLVEKMQKMDLVTANNVFSHADDLEGFATAVHSVLSDAGVFVFEVSYLKDTIDNFVVDYIYHEHLCYHSVFPLKRFLESCQLKLIHVERVPTKGGSIRCYAVKSTNPLEPSPIVDKMIAEEMLSGLYNLDTYRDLEQRITHLRESLRKLIKGHQIAAYGASATSTVLNALLGISESISFIVDDNERRQGRFSPGHLIPVLSSQALLDYLPSITIISAWRFAEDIINKNQRYQQAGGRFVIPFPTLREAHARNC